MNDTIDPRRIRVRCLWAVLVLGSAALTPVMGQVTPGVSDFELTDDYDFLVDGAVAAEAEIFVSRQAQAFLILADELESPVMVEPRSQRVTTLQLLKVARSDTGVEVLPDATLAEQGSFEVEGSAVSFSVDGRNAGLAEKPPLVGDHDPSAIVAYNANYGREAERYSSSEPILRQLREQSETVRIRVFFGTWCPYCKQVVPRVMKVAEQLEGSKIQIEFHGLPRQIGEDPEASRLDIHSVPTGVVFVGDDEVARISGGSWKIPELAIRNAIPEPSS